jgi:hypothetical protein
VGARFLNRQAGRERCYGTCPLRTDICISLFFSEANFAVIIAGGRRGRVRRRGVCCVEGEVLEGWGGCESAGLEVCWTGVGKEIFGLPGLLVD